VLAAYRTFHLTNVIKDLYFNLSNAYRWTVSLSLGFGALLAGLGAHGDLPLWAVWILGVALFCIPPLGALAVRARAPEATRASVKATVAPLMLVAAILIPSQLIIGTALKPLVEAGASFNVAANVTTEDAPAWTQTVVDGTCGMVTLPSTWTPDASFLDACPGNDENTLDGWRASAAVNLEQLGIQLARSHHGVEAARKMPSDAPLPPVDNSTAATAASEPDEQFVIFWGDSTVRFQFKFWVELAGSKLEQLPDFSMTTMSANVSGGNARPLPPDPTQLFVWTANGTIGDKPATILYVGGGIMVPIELAPKVLPMLDGAPYNFGLTKRATTVVVGAGALHHLHLEPLKEFEHYDAWLSLEDRIKEGTDGLQLLLPQARLLYFTIHSMCDNLLFEDGWADMADRYNLGLGNCSQPRCTEATFNRRGAINWYQREMAVMREPERARTWGVIDAFKMTEGQCWATADGRHFNPIVPQFAMSAFAQMGTTRVI